MLCVSFAVIYKVIAGLRYDHKPLRDFYDVLEIDEFWTYVGRKGHKVWLSYAYHRRSGEMVAHGWGKRDTRTAEKLRRRLVRLGVRYGAIATDSQDSFGKVFGGERFLTGKQHTKGIEGEQLPPASQEQTLLQEDLLLLEEASLALEGIRRRSLLHKLWPLPCTSILFVIPPIYLLCSKSHAFTSSLDIFPEATPKPKSISSC